jgi:hypothetical protein
MINILSVYLRRSTNFIIDEVRCCNSILVLWSDIVLGHKEEVLDNEVRISNMDFLWVLLISVIRVYESYSDWSYWIYKGVLSFVDVLFLSFLFTQPSSCSSLDSSS